MRIQGKGHLDYCVRHAYILKKIKEDCTTRYLYILYIYICGLFGELQMPAGAAVISTNVSKTNWGFMKRWSTNLCGPRCSPNITSGGHQTNRGYYAEFGFFMTMALFKGRQPGAHQNTRPPQSICLGF